MAFGESFLRIPDLFPARQSGESWGSNQVVIRFAGSDYICDGLSATQAAAVVERFGELCSASVATARDAVEISVFRAAEGDFFDNGRE